MTYVKPGRTPTIRQTSYTFESVSVPHAWECLTCGASGMGDGGEKHPRCSQLLAPKHLKVTVEYTAQDDEVHVLEWESKPGEELTFDLSAERPFKRTGNRIEPTGEFLLSVALSSKKP